MSKKIKITDFLNELVKLEFYDGSFFEGYFVKSKYFKDKWSILPLTKENILDFSNSQIKSITWLNNNVTIKRQEIDFTKEQKELCL